MRELQEHSCEDSQEKFLVGKRKLWNRKWIRWHDIGNNGCMTI